MGVARDPPRRSTSPFTSWAMTCRLARLDSYQLAASVQFRLPSTLPRHQLRSPR